MHIGRVWSGELKASELLSERTAAWSVKGCPNQVWEGLRLVGLGKQHVWFTLCSSSNSCVCLLEENEHVLCFRRAAM
jgi:hypothetical protein